MNIALDYDGTFSAEKSGWLEFIDSFTMRGHKIYIVTYRNEIDKNEEFDQLYWWKDVSTIYTDGKAKRQFVRELGIEIDIWIDDRPETILEDSKITPEEYQVWREEIRKNERV
ncbi:MAG: HAD family hydrolase [Candidatus Obscuribacterales bacterium]